MNKEFFYLEDNGLKILQSRLLADLDWLDHGFTTRLGGMSRGQYNSLNLALHVGDDNAAVLSNRGKVSRVFNWQLENWSAGEQVHGCHIETVRKGGRGSLAAADAYSKTDGMITNVPGVVLSTYAADCIPILLCDPVKRAIGVVHAGWKGTVQLIAAEAVTELEKNYGTDPADCLAVIGPGIGPDCFEVDSKVKDIWQEKFSFCSEVVKAGRLKDKYFIDLWQTNKMQLIERGLKPDNIAVAEISTFLGTDLFYSYRAEAGKTGRHAGLICLKNR